jgi:hypothetical protein
MIARIFKKIKKIHWTTFGTFPTQKNCHPLICNLKNKFIRFVTVEEIALHFSRPKNNFVILNNYQKFLIFVEKVVSNNDDSQKVRTVFFVWELRDFSRKNKNLICLDLKYFLKK